jgi:hypothetical protein
MTTDICDAHVSLTSQNALRDWNAMVLAFLAHGTETPIHLGAVLTEAPDFAMGHAARGLFSLMMGRRELIAVAQGAAIEAHKCLAQGGPVSTRERAWVEALDVWLGGEPSGAIAAMERALKQTPSDTLSAKVSHLIRFILGDAKGMRHSLEQILDAHGDDHACRGYALGCYAFSLEETGDYKLAEAVGRLGLTHARDDAWGLHAVAHVYDMMSRSAEGIKLIDANASAWSNCNNFRYHVWWHKALLHLDLGDTATVLALYDEKIRYEKTDDYRDIANATSLLCRLELEGVNVGDRWVELAEFSENRVGDGCLVFADLHYILALSGDNRDDARSALMSRIRVDAVTKKSEMAQIFAGPGLAAANGLAAFGEGRYDLAFQYLAPARVGMKTVGGSHAQRDVFERITVDAGLRAGYYDDVEDILLDRHQQRAGISDRFASSLFEMIEAARQNAVQIPAQ